MDEAVWNHSTFSANRDRLLNETIARSFFAKVLGCKTARVDATGWTCAGSDRLTRWEQRFPTNEWVARARLSSGSVVSRDHMTVCSLASPSLWLKSTRSKKRSVRRHQIRQPQTQAADGNALLDCGEGPCSRVKRPRADDISADIEAYPRGPLEHIVRFASAESGCRFSQRTESSSGEANQPHGCRTNKSQLDREQSREASAPD